MHVVATALHVVVVVVAVGVVGLKKSSQNRERKTFMS